MTSQQFEEINPILTGGGFKPREPFIADMGAIAIDSLPSKIALGLPVNIEFKITTADARSNPLLQLSGKEEIHLIPLVSKLPPK